MKLAPYAITNAEWKPKIDTDPTDLIYAPLFAYAISLKSLVCSTITSFHIVESRR